MAITLNGTYSSTVSLTDPATQNPATVSSTGVIAVASPDAFSAGLLGVAGFAWTIANFGVVQSTGSYGIGISLESGGSITNGAADSTAGYIGGRAIGIQLNGAPGTSAIVVNYGTVKASSAYLFGNAIVTDGVSGTIVNSGSIIAGNAVGGAANGVQLGAGGIVNNSGLISAFSDGADQAGVVSFSGVTSVSNTGAIVTTGTSGTGVNIVAGTIGNLGLISSARQGVAIGSGYIANGGIISQTGTAGSQAIDLGGAGGPATLVNTGIVSSEGTAGHGVLVGVGGGRIVNGVATSPAAVITAYHTGIGFFPGTAASSGVLSIVNYGQIRSTQLGAAAGNAFTINAGVGSTTVVDNFGTISSAQTNGGGAILLDAGQITNHAGGLIRAAGGNGISNSNTPLTVINSGTIIGSGVTGIGAVLAAGSTLTNSGVIVGESGTALTFAGGGNRLIVAPDAVFGGGVYGGSGVLELAVGNGFIGGLGGLNGSITGLGTVVLDRNAAWVVKIDNPAAFAGTISGLTSNDGLDLTVGFDPNGIVNLLPGNLLQVNQFGSSFTLQLDPNRNFAGTTFDLSASTTGGTLVSMAVGQPAPRDFNGDGRSDVLWQNDNGAIYIWEMVGAATLASGQPGTVDASWRISGTGDFNGDRMSDILWRHDSGGIYVWLMNGVTPIIGSQVGAADASWHIRSTGDFNGDSRSDILWQHDSGVAYIWEMNGFTPLASGAVGSADASWHIRGADDFNGDFKSDILWQHDSGAVYVWEMDGFTSIGSGQVGSADASWHISGTGDFNGDSKADILWQHDSGNVYVWLMDGTTSIGSGQVGFADASWHIEDVGDFGGDDRSDILWRNDDGGVYVWEMDGLTAIASGQAGSADASWHIIPPDNTGITGAAFPAAASASASFDFSDISSAGHATGDTAVATASTLPSSLDEGGGAFPLLAGTAIPTLDTEMLRAIPG